MHIAETRYEHIILNDKGQPVIQGTRFKVIELALDKMAYGWSPEELQYQHPQLSLGQIFSALAYYADHREEFDNDMENQLRDIDKTKSSLRPAPLVKRLKAKGLI